VRVMEEAGVYTDVLDEQKGKLAPKDFYDIIHICFPYSESFEEAVRAYMQEYKPKLVIVHSTVAVGTLENEETVAFSYVTGRHPHLDKEMKKFTRLIGTKSEETFVKASEELQKIGFWVCPDQFPVRDVQLAKIADTTYYGVCIAWHKYLRQMAEFYGVNTETLTFSNEVYNDGYTELNASQYIRPVLRFEQGKIGGHCVVQNAQLLQKDFPTNPLLTSILEAI